MKKEEKKGHTVKKTTVPQPRADIPLALVTLAYIIIPNFAPNLMAFDTNAPKFLGLSLVNLAGFLVLLTRRENLKNPGLFGIFFKIPVGVIYSGFLAFSLLSFLNAINLTETVLQFTKIFTVFSAVYVLFFIIRHNLHFLKWIIIIYCCLLIVDSMMVFSYISQFIQGKIDSIMDVKFVYSNKNMFASAIFVKLPAALWLMLYRKDWLKYFGWFGVAAGITATFFTATRTFYFGLIVFTIFFIIYMLTQYYRSRQTGQLWMTGSFVLALLIAYLAFTGTQEYLYPKSKSADGGRLVQGVGQQIASINAVDESARARLDEWGFAWKLLTEKPLLGVGSGNFKVAVLKYENKAKADFSYMHKAHNDFIEIFAETGYIGGLLYLGIFLFIGWTFLRMLIKNFSGEDELFQYFFMATIGLTFYSIDAFFNFPADRPEILSYFSFYLATGMAVMHRMKLKPDDSRTAVPGKKTPGWKLWLPAGAALVMLASASWIFYLNFESSKTQRIVYEEIQSGTLRTRSDRIIAGFPAIPNLTIMAESISVQKARYLLSEKKNRQAIDILLADQASPWDGRREYFMAMGYTQLGDKDSALYYSEALYKMKPLHPKNLLLICQMLEARKEYTRVEEYLDTFLETTKNNDQVWTFYSGFYDRIGNLDKSWEKIEEAIKYMPNDTLVEKQHYFIFQKKFVQPHKAKYTEARALFDSKEYNKALTQVNEYISLVPNDFHGYQLKAFALYYLKQYQECIREIDHAVTLSKDTGAIISLRGVCYRSLNNMEAACKDFEKSMKLGNADGKTNYERYCMGKLL
jgi:O-antigen ligase/tetratricopeptide (TPR) repeat protein